MPFYTKTDVIEVKKRAAERGIFFAPACDGILGMDAQPTGITQSSSGTASQFLTFVDPRIIEIVQAPLKSTKILPEIKYGDRKDKIAMFKISEINGSSVAYSDESEAGTVNPNFTFPERQSYAFQVVTSYGEMEVESYGAAAINYIQSQNKGSVTILNQDMNRFNFYGVAGLKCYGILNDPNLPTPITPLTNAASKTKWKDKDAVDIYNDCLELITQLITQGQGWIEDDSPMVMSLSPTSYSFLNRPASQLLATVKERLVSTYPNLAFETAVQYSTASGELVQLHATEIAGQQTGNCAFIEKLRAHPVIQGLSSWKQKKSAATWGAVITQPVAFAQMLGV